MKKWIAVFAIGMSVVAYGSEGGVGSGGGGTLPAEQVPENDLVDAVLESRAVIDVFMKGIEGRKVLFDATKPNDFTHAYEKLLLDGNTVFDLMPKVQIVMNRQRPCSDFENNPVDASVNAGIPNGICFSIPRLHEKLSIANYRGEITALMLHELSHLFGANEDEAVTIQKYSIRFLSAKDPLQVHDWYYDRMKGAEGMQNSLDLVAEAIESGGKVDCRKLQDLQMGLLEQLHGLGDGATGMFLTRERDTEYYWQLHSRIMAASDYLCSLPGFSDDFDQSFYLEHYNRGFAGATKVSADDYFNRAINSKETFIRFPLVTVWLDRLSDVTAAAAEFAAVSKEMEKLNELLTSQWNAKFSLAM